MKLLLTIGFLLASSTIGMAQDKIASSETSVAQEAVNHRERQLNDIIKNLTLQVPKANAERRTELFRQIQKTYSMLTAGVPMTVATQKEVLDSVIIFYLTPYSAYNAAGLRTLYATYNYVDGQKSLSEKVETSYDEKGRITMDVNLPEIGAGYKCTNHYDDDELTWLHTYQYTDKDMYPQLGDPEYTLIHYKDSLFGNPIQLITYTDNTAKKTERYVYKKITVEDTTAINKVAEDHQMITVLGRKITTEGTETVSVYNLSGQLISKDGVASVEPGTYIVRADGKSIKVLVK